MLNINLKGVSDHLTDIAKRAKDKRLLLNITQLELAERSGVSLGSVRRFENSGLVSLSALLSIALVLGNLNDFEQLFHKDIDVDLFAPEPKKRLRGTRRKNI
jgi:transcriptional regulator with XRE-family HTH domain